jgi:hypothetical protein
MLHGPVRNRFSTEAIHRRDVGVDGMTRLVQRVRSHDRNLGLRSSTCHAARAFSTEVSIIQLNLSPQHVGLSPLTHGPEDCVVQQSGGVSGDG